MFYHNPYHAICIVSLLKRIVTPLHYIVACVRFQDHTVEIEYDGRYDGGKSS